MGRAHRTPRDRRRRELSQNFLRDDRVAADFLTGAGLGPDDLVVDLGAGTGALTLPLARTGARVVAVERDPAWAAELERRVRAEGVTGGVKVLRMDLRDFPLPRRPYRVVANPPFSLSTDLLAMLLDDPDRGPVRADLLLQAEVARKRAASPPATLRTAAWAPWWRFTLNGRVDRRAFRPVPGVDAAWLTVIRREEPALPTWLAPGFAEVLRPHWHPPA